MKRVGNIWQQVVSFDNLLAASYRALRGKRSRPDAAAFFMDLEHNLVHLQDRLASGSYQPETYRTFEIREPKRRLISVAPFGDRVVHHALVRVIEPWFERRFIHHSYACRRGKGQHRCLERFVPWARGSRYVLQCDVRRFFPSIDHEILKQQLARVIKDRRVLDLAERIIDGSNPQDEATVYFAGDDLFTPWIRRRGLPIGNLTSQFFANVYLDSLDHFVKERLRIRRYLRYCDDFALMGEDRQALWSARDRLGEHLAALRLKLHPRKSRVRRVGEGIEFLGFVVGQRSMRVRRSTVRRMRRRLRRLERSLAAGEIGLDRVRQSLQSSLAHMAHGDTLTLRRALVSSRRWPRPGAAAGPAPA